MTIQLVKPKDYTATQSILHDMFTENTGMSMMDSGGDGNRHWQRNQEVVDFREREPYTYSFDGRYLEITKDLFWHLNDALEYDPLGTTKFERWVKGDEDRLNDLSGVEEYVTGYGNKSYPFSQEVDSGNSYNDENLLNQVFQYVLDRPQVYIAIHGGCDVRGGYTDYKAFEYEEEYLFDSCRATLTCQCEQGINYVYTDDCGAHWYEDWTGHTWNNGLPVIWQKHLFKDKLFCKICKEDVEVGA